MPWAHRELRRAAFSMDRASTTTISPCSRTLRLTESKSLQFRVEAFNVFNHAQFYGPSAVDGNINSSTFGQVLSAAPPRLVQVGAKFIF